jgi:hypothetical protein
LYGDHFRSPGRDDRQDGTGSQQAPWEAERGPAPTYDDVKVAGSPDHTRPVQHTGSDDAGAYETTALPRPGAAGAYDPAETPAEGNPVVSYDMGDRHGEEPVYGDDGRGTAVYEAGATSAMPPFPGPDAGATATDFEAIRRTPHATNKKKLIRFAAVAAAIAVVGGGGAAWAVTSGGSSGKPQASRPQAQPPVPAPLTDAQRKDAEDKRRKELKKRASRAARDELVRPRLLARGTPPPTKKPDTAAGTAGDPVPVGEAQQIARAMLPDFGWSPSSQFGCLVNLWDKESGWNTHASNPSGAYGIPQALPGSKMSTAGPDWQNNAHTQITWGLGYIKDRYSSPCGAWAHSESTGWY